MRALLSSLAYSLTTDKSEYAVGQPVQMTFTETNTSIKMCRSTTARLLMVST